MMEDTHIADGIALTLLLVGVVLTSGAAGVVGFAPATAHADGPSGPHASALAFPIDNLTAATGTPLTVLDGKGNDPFPAAFPIDNLSVMFPINNVTVRAGPWDVRDTDPIGVAGAADVTISFRMQDMDPYALSRGPDGLPQDMDPY
ncbi:hypothetical protein [Salinigranum marinum]|uniref:hypothetical protein n=1 Tax=Salinigranum marinum TaxID=1515595 RepID=UPI00298A0416|nr:hypothetical protein [Salinigranum marinum]